MNDGPQLFALRVLSMEVAPGPAVLHFNDFGREMPLVGYAWLYRCQANDSWTLIDTGIEDVEWLNIGRPQQRQWRAHSVRNALAQRNVLLEEVHDVILTHVHADHCGSIHLFPGAQWHVPAIEWDFVCDPANNDLVPTPPFSRQAIEHMKDHGVRLLRDGDRPVRGLRMIHTGGHTVGSMAVEACDKADRARVVLAVDVMPLYENLSRQIPPGTLWHWGDCVRALKNLAAYDVPVLPSHDPKLLSEFPDGIILNE